MHSRKWKMPVDPPDDCELCQTWIPIFPWDWQPNYDPNPLPQARDRVWLRNSRELFSIPDSHSRYVPGKHNERLEAYQNEVLYPKERNWKTVPIANNHALIQDIRHTSCSLYTSSNAIVWNFGATNAQYFISQFKWLKTYIQSWGIHAKCAFAEFSDARQPYERALIRFPGIN